MSWGLIRQHKHISDILTEMRTLPSIRRDLHEENLKYVAAFCVILIAVVIISANINVVTWSRRSIRVLLPTTGIYQLGGDYTNPYLPHYFYFTALFTLPVRLVYGHFADPIYTAAQIPPVLGFVGIVIGGAAVQRTREKQTMAILLLGSFAPFWIDILQAGSDLFSAGLVLLGLYWLAKEKWMLAGLFIGLSTFKLLTIPLAFFLGIALLMDDRARFKHYVFGGVLSQLPNVWYFIWFPNHLRVFLTQPTGVSQHAGKFNTVLLLPIVESGLEDVYITLLLPMLILGFGILTIWQYQQGHLPIAAALSLFPMMYLLPAETRPEPLLAVVLVMIVLSKRSYSIHAAFLYWFAHFWPYLPESDRAASVNVAPFAIEAFLDSHIQLLTLVVVIGSVIYARRSTIKTAN